MQHEHGHALWTWTCSMGMDTQHSFDNAACIRTMDMHGCRNAGMPIKCPVQHRWFSVSLPLLVRHRHSGIMVSPEPLVTDQSVSAQLWWETRIQKNSCKILSLTGWTLVEEGRRGWDRWKASRIPGYRPNPQPKVNGPELPELVHYNKQQRHIMRASWLDYM